MDGADGVFRTVSIGYLYCDVVVKLMAAGAVSNIELVVPLSGDIVEERNGVEPVFADVIRAAFAIEVVDVASFGLDVNLAMGGILLIDGCREGARPTILREKEHEQGDAASPWDTWFSRHVSCPSLFVFHVIIVFDDCMSIIRAMLVF